MNKPLAFLLERKTDLLGLRVRVYRNLTRDCWSLVSRETSLESFGRVIGHVSEVELENCKLHVSEAGMKSVRLSGRKNVHAWIEGDVKRVGLLKSILPDKQGEIVARYNPYTSPGPYFVAADGVTPVYELNSAILNKDFKILA